MYFSSRKSVFLYLCVRARARGLITLEPKSDKKKTLPLLYQIRFERTNCYVLISHYPHVVLSFFLYNCCAHLQLVCVFSLGEGGRRIKQL